jgi:hypothetical protein
MDQTLVRSGFDAEIALGERYLQYLLLLALDAGIFPATFDTADEQNPENGPIQARLIIPVDVDRTYELDPAAEIPEPGSPNGFAVKILFDNEFMADLRVTVRAHLTRASPVVDNNTGYTLFVRLGLQKTPESAGPGLASAGLSIELVHADGVADFAKLKTLVDRTLSLDGLGAGGRVQDFALRKFPAQGTSPASIHLYVNLMLRSGPEEDRFLPARGDVLLGNNILQPDTDMVFATRKDIYAAVAADGFYRRAVPSGSGYAYPLKFKHRKGKLLNVSVEPTTGNQDNRLRTKIKAEVEVDNWFDPDITLIVDIFGSIDDEGVMTWNSLSDAHDSSFLYDVLLAGVAAALIPLIGPGAALAVFTGLELAKHIGEELISEYYIRDKAKKRHDAKLLDLAPNRLTYYRRPSYPFNETQHQNG